MDVVRITELQPKTYVEQGDYIAIDNQSDGTKKVQFTNLLDDTLSQENKIAPANVVGDKIATVRDTMEDEIATIRAAVGSPLKASTVAQMTDKNKIYVYVGSESGYTNGNWYYWNGSAWTSGGVYNSVAVVTDPTLTLSGVPADAKVTGDEIGNLKSEINYICDDVWKSYDLTTATGTSRGRLKYENSSFGIPSSDLYDVTSLVNVEGYKYISLDYNLTPVAGYGTIVVGYFNSSTMDTPTIVGYEGIATKDKILEIPNGTKFVALTCPTGTHPTVTLYANAVAEIDNRVTEIKSELLVIDSVTTTTYFVGGRITTSGGLTSSSVYDATNFVNIEGYEKLSVDYSANAAGTCIIGYFASDTLSSANLISYESTVIADALYSIPSGTKFIALSCPTGTHPVVSLYRNRIDSMEDKIDGLVDSLPRATDNRSDSMGANDSLEVSVGNLKKNTVLGFSANITNFGSLQIGQGRTANAESAYVVIDNSSAKVYSYYGSSAHLEGDYSHGLTVADYIDVRIEESNDEIGYAKISITSNGQTYTINRVRWMGYYKIAYADVISGSYTNCLLSFYCADYTKDYWLFGDSYFDHWVPKSLENGYSNFLCDGVSGRKSDEAYASLERNLLHGKPNAIVWCMGMNNGDTSSAVNSSWNTYYTMLKNLCSARGINLILCTIPNVPSVNNNYKNAIIRSSGYRYIDLAKAVGSDISTSWYTGLLSSDQVHPSSLGDEMIARFMESALPEITN